MPSDSLNHQGKGESKTLADDENTKINIKEPSLGEQWENVVSSAAHTQHTTGKPTRD